MDTLLSVAGVIFAIYIVIKLNRLVTVSVGVINTSVELAEESMNVYSTDVKINLAKKRAEQLDELSDMEHIPTSEDIITLLAGKSKTETKTEA